VVVLAVLLRLIEHKTLLVEQADCTVTVATETKCLAAMVRYRAVAVVVQLIMQTAHLVLAVEAKYRFMSFVGVLLAKFSREYHYESNSHYRR
jgi:hypothetical protein